MAAVGRPKKEIDYEVVEAAARMDSTLEECAALCKVSFRTIKRAAASDGKFQEAWDRGKAIGRITLRRQMRRSADAVIRYRDGKDEKTGKPKYKFGVSPAAVSMQIWLSKHVLGMNDKATLQIDTGGGERQRPCEALFVSGNFDVDRLSQEEVAELSRLCELIDTIGIPMISKEERERAVELVLKGSTPVELEAPEDEEEEEEGKPDGVTEEIIALAPNGEVQEEEDDAALGR